MSNTTVPAIDVEAELRQYIDTALWTSTDDGSDPLDAMYTADDIPADVLATLRAELVDFLTWPEHWDVLEGEQHAAALSYWVAELGPGQIGHDFWLTRNGHGSGFWDRFSGDSLGAAYGALLTRYAKAHGASDLYVGDDGKLHVA